MAKAKKSQMNKPESEKRVRKPRENPVLKALHNEKARLDKAINLSEMKTRNLRNELYKVVVAIRAMLSNTSETYGQDLFRDVLSFIEFETKALDNVAAHLVLLNKKMSRANIRKLLTRMVEENLLTQTGRGITIAEKGRKFLAGEEIAEDSQTEADVDGSVLSG